MSMKRNKGLQQELTFTICGEEQCGIGCGKGGGGEPVTIMLVWTCCTEWDQNQVQINFGRSQ